MHPTLKGKIILICCVKVLPGVGTESRVLFTHPFLTQASLSLIYLKCWSKQHNSTSVFLPADHSFPAGGREIVRGGGPAQCTWFHLSKVKNVLHFQIVAYGDERELLIWL